MAKAGILGELVPRSEIGPIIAVEGGFEDLHLVLHPTRPDLFNEAKGKYDLIPIPRLSYGGDFHWTQTPRKGVSGVPAAFETAIEVVTKHQDLDLNLIRFEVRKEFRRSSERVYTYIVFEICGARKIRNAYSLCAKIARIMARAAQDYETQAHP